MDENGLMILITALCGLLMVCGAFVLLYHGTIKLEPPDQNALATEFTIAKIVKIKTNIASLVLFVIGFAFLWLGFKHTSTSPAPIQIEGRVTNLPQGEDGKDLNITVCGAFDTINAEKEGSNAVEFNKTITPNLGTFKVTFSKPGLGELRTYTLTHTPDQHYLLQVQIDNHNRAQIDVNDLEPAVALAPPTAIDPSKEANAAPVAKGGKLYATNR